MDLTAKDPVADSSESLQTLSSEGRRSSARRRRRRRVHKRSNIRAQIRLRMWIACTGALIAMVVALYLALGRGERAAESGLQLVNAPATVAAASLTPSPAA